MPLDARRVDELAEPWRTKRKGAPRMVDLANGAGFTDQSSLHDLIHKRPGRIRLEQLEGLADALGVPVLDLLTQRHEISSVYWDRGFQAGRSETIADMHDFLNKMLRTS